MGRSGSMACLDCKIDVYLGYGSYSTWLDGCDSVEEFDTVEDHDDLKQLRKNQNVRKFLTWHDGHNIVHYSSDWTTHRDGNLYQDGGYGPDLLVIKDMASFRSLDWAADVFTGARGCDLFSSFDI